MKKSAIAFSCLRLLACDYSTGRVWDRLIIVMPVVFLVILVTVVFAIPTPLISGACFAAFVLVSSHAQSAVLLASGPFR